MPEFFHIPLMAAGRCFIAILGFSLPGLLQANSSDYALGPGDVVRITVFQNPELTTDTRVSQLGTITFPLVGELTVGGLSTAGAERLIAQRLSDGHFLSRPHVNVIISQFRSIQVSVLGEVNRPGKYPLEQTHNSLSEVLALAGGIAPTGGESVTVVRNGGGDIRRIDIDLSGFTRGKEKSFDIPVQNGDVLFVPRYPVFYIYGEVQRPGQFRLERGMTVMQALALGGGLTIKGTERGIRIARMNAQGQTESKAAAPDERIMSDDVVYVKESFF